MTIAAFVLGVTPEGKIPAVVRPDGQLGLPGGKALWHEDGRAAARRESMEEGWLVLDIEDHPFFVAREGECLVLWFWGGLFEKVDPRPEDEARGIRPVLADPSDLRGLCNEAAIQAARAQGYPIP